LKTFPHSLQGYVFGFVGSDEPEGNAPSTVKTSTPTTSANFVGGLFEFRAFDCDELTATY
jgi:hypothetical protein